MKLKSLAALALLMILGAGSLRAAENDLELVIVRGASPLLVRLAAEVDGRPLPAIWDDAFAALSSFFDRNADGHLDEAEAARLPAVSALREVLGLGFTPPLGQPPAWQDVDADRDGKATPGEVAAYYRRAGLGRPVVGAGKMPFSADLTGSLLKLLDLDGDNDVDEKEWQAAPQALAKLDRNDDELVGAGELVSRVLYPGAAGSRILSPPQAGVQLPADSRNFPVIVLPVDVANGEWAAIIVERLDKNADSKLSAAELGWKVEPLAALDADKDNLLSAAELREWRKSPADAACTVRLSATGSRPALSADSQSSSAGSLAWERPGLQVALRADAGKLTKTAEDAKSFYTRQFTEADASGDGNLADDELSKGRSNPWQPIAAVADRDGNGQLSRAEFDAWLGLQAKLAAGHVLVTVLDGEAGLFELLDMNHDGALSLAELREAGGRLQKLGVLAEGKFNSGAIPASLLVTASRGYPQSPLGLVERSGPAWFLAMDRNGDGNVSRREFSGPADAFEKLDANRDQLLTPAEATPAGQ